MNLQQARGLTWVRTRFPGIKLRLAYLVGAAGRILISTNGEKQGFSGADGDWVEVSD